MSVTSYCATPWRITLPLSQTDWEINSPPKLAKVLQSLEQIQQDFNSSQSNGETGSGLVLVMRPQPVSVARQGEFARLLSLIRPVEWVTMRFRIERFRKCWKTG